MYGVIKDWACREYGIDPDKVVRPFYPGGDYERFDYSGGAVVVDNPPFSILSKICTFYRTEQIPFFLFAPYLTIFSSTSRNGAHMIVTDSNIEYANGAQVNTSFVTSFGDDLIRTAPDLANAIDETVKRVRKEQRRHPPKYAYPRELLTVSRLGKIGRQVEFRVKASDVAFTRALDSQKAVKKAIYGGGYLLSEAKAVEFLLEYFAPTCNIAPLSALKLGEGRFRVYSVLCLRGLPPPTPRPGRCAFHWSMVSGSQPRVRPMVTSGSGRS